MVACRMPTNNPQRMAYLAADVLTSKKASSMPTGSSVISQCTVFRSVMQMTMGLPLTILRFLCNRCEKVAKAGGRKGTKILVDEFGFAIANAPLDNGWTRAHDACLRKIERMLIAAGVDVQSEVTRRF